MLDDLDNGGTKTAEGGAELKKDYFDLLVTQLSKEIQDLMSICKNVLSLPQQYSNKQKKESTDQSIILSFAEIPFLYILLSIRGFC